MLTPKQLEQCPDGMVELYAQLESDILADMARRIATYDYFIPSAQWQFKKQKELGNLSKDIIKVLSRATGKSEEELRRLMSQAGAEALVADDEIYRTAGKEPPPVNQSKALLAVLNAAYKKTDKLFKNLTKTTARTATGQFEAALDRAHLQIMSGAFDQNTAIRNAVKNLSKQGIGAVKYPSGHTDTIEAAVRRATVTGVNQTCIQLQLARAEEMGCDLVETTAHGGARPEHAVWQGRVFSLSGKHDKYPDFYKSTGYGTGAGLGGWNCRHSFSPFFEGISNAAYSEAELKDYEAKKYRFNGVKMTEYEASQKQRYIERQKRRWKRENAAMAAAGLDTSESAAKIAKWSAIEKDFCRQTGLKRQAERSFIGDAKKRAAHEFGSRAVPLNTNATFDVDIPQLSDIVNKSVSKANRSVVYQGAKTGHEHMVLIDVKSGKWVYTEEGIAGEVGGEEYVKFINEHTDKSYIFVHNHADGRTFSYVDLISFFYRPQINMLIAAGNNGKIYIAHNKKRNDINILDMCVMHPEKYVDLSDLQKLLADGELVYFEYNAEVAVRTVNYVLDTYAERIEIQT